MTDHGDNVPSPDFDELLGVYALDAVSDEERDAIERYLAVDRRAAEEVREHREVAALLVTAEGITDAPADTWSRIAARLDGPVPEAGPSLAKVIGSIGDGATPARRSPRWLWPGVAAAAALVIGLLLGASLLRDGSTLEDRFAATASSDRARHAELRADDPTVPGARAVIGAEGEGFIDMRLMPALASDETYQLWGIVGDTPVSLGVLGSDPDVAAFTAADSVATLAITVERAGGAGQPSHDPDLIGTVTTA